jgi:hypothetical protein
MECQLIIAHLPAVKNLTLVQCPDGLEFYYETTLVAPVAQTVQQLAEVHNLLALCRKLVVEVAAETTGCGCCCNSLASACWAVTQAPDPNLA